jgi:hypothetical protein
MLLLVPLRAVSFANAKQNAVLVRCNYYKTDPSFLSWLIQDQTIALEKHGIGLPTMQKVVRHTRSGNFCCRRLNISRLSGNRKRLAFRVGGLKARGRHRQGGLPEHKFLSVRGSILAEPAMAILVGADEPPAYFLAWLGRLYLPMSRLRVRICWL